MKLSVRLGKLVDGRTRSHALAGSGQEQLKSGHVRTVPVPERVFANSVRGSRRRESRVERCSVA